jgi:hypothetical protein
MIFGRQRLERDQDQHIEEIHGMAVRMKKTGEEINLELQRQEGLVHELDNQIDLTTNKLEGVQR